MSCDPFRVGIGSLCIPVALPPAIEFVAFGDIALLRSAYPDALTKRHLAAPSFPEWQDQLHVTIAHAQVAQPITAGQGHRTQQANVGIPWRTQTVDNIIAGSPNTGHRDRDNHDGECWTYASVPPKTARTWLSLTSLRSFLIRIELIIFERTLPIGSSSTFSTSTTWSCSTFTITGTDVTGRHRDRHVAGIGLGEISGRETQSYSRFRQCRLPGLPSNIESKLKIRTMRVLGDPKLHVRRVLASWGNVSLMPGVPFVARPDVDVLIVGETHEWELVEYVQDAIASGQKKALIVLGHVVSEQAGLKYCAEWLRGFIKEVPIEFVAASEPFWRPDKPLGNSMISSCVPSFPSSVSS